MLEPTTETGIKRVVHKDSLISSLEHLCNNEKMSDVTFVVGEREIFAHRTILGARSPYFYAMLFGSMKEGKQDRVEIMDSSVEAEQFLTLLKYIYTGEVIITPKNVMCLLYLAKMYDLRGLKDACVEYVQHNATAEGALDLYVTANNFNEPSIAQKCLQLIRSDPRTALCVPELVDLAEDVLVTILSDDEMFVDELFLFRQAVSWLRHRKATASSELTASVLKHVRFSLIAKDKLVTEVKMSGLVPLELYLEALEFHAAPHHFDSSLPKFKARGQSCITLDFTSVGDNKGALYFIGTNEGKSAWMNPSKSGKIKVTASGAVSGDVHDFVDNRPTQFHITNSTPNSWIMIDLVNHTLKPSHYSLYHHLTDNSHFLRNWRLEGSLDSLTWTVLKTHMRDGTITSQGHKASWPISTSSFFRYFRLCHTGPNATQNHYMVCSGFEIYGDIVAIHSSTPL